MKSKELLRLANRRKRFRDKKLNLLYHLAARVANNSSNFMVWDLRKRPKLFSIYPVNTSNYVQNQIFANEIKFNNNSYEDHLLVFEHLISAISKDEMGKKLRVICHGIRNGSEVIALRDLLSRAYSEVEVVGTDISPTVLQYPFGIQMDFQEPIPTSLGKFDIVYSNSLDQALHPRKTLENWLLSLSNNPGSFVALRMTQLHGKMGSSELDPFSCEPEVFPYLFLDWFSSFYYIEKLIYTGVKNSRDTMFIIKKLPKPKLG